MSEHGNDGFGSFLAGFVVGGLAGAIVALLFAPQSGAETRTLIKDKTIELKDKAASSYREFEDKTKEFTKETTEKAEAFYNQAKAKVESLKSKAALALEDVNLPKAKKAKG